MHNAVIIDAVRTPMGRGKAGGQLSGVHPVDLLSACLRALVSRNDIDPALVDDVMIGCVSQAGEQSSTPGRGAVLAAGFPEHVPAVTIERKCGSGQQAIDFASQAIASGACDLVIAGGVESMSQVPMGSARQGRDPFGPNVNKRYAPGLVSQGIAAELVAARWKLTRAELDAYSERSHRLAACARSSGMFEGEIIPVQTPVGWVYTDETIREGTTMEQLGNLNAAFVDQNIAARFPEIDWRVTAGNSSQITDGASALLIASEAMAGRLGLMPMARIVASSVRGSDPILMLTGPMDTTRRVLAKAGLQLGEIEHFEINEAFASVPLAWAKELGADPQRLNPLGGAIALGHPLGASGARLMTTMIHALRRSEARFGLQSMCEAGGMSNATIIERL